MNNRTTHIIRGKLYWAKVLGKARMNTFTGENEWSVDITPDAKSMAEIKRLGLTSKLKNKDDERGDFLSFRHREFRTLKDGTREANKPIRIQDIRGNPWDDRLIGNGTVADLKFLLQPKGPGRPNAGTYVQAIRVLDLVPYETQDFAPISEDDEFFGETEGDAFAEPDSKPEDPFGFEDDDIPGYGD